MLHHPSDTAERVKLPFKACVTEILAVFCSLQPLPLEVSTSSVTVGSGIKQVTRDIRYALRSFPPLTSRAWQTEEGFSEEVQAGGEAGC